MHVAVLDSIPDRLGICNKEFFPETRREGEAESQSLLSLGLNFKPLRSAYGVEAYVLLIAIRSSDGDVKPGDPLDSFRKEQANDGSGFPLHPGV